jgi:hypothetical protein
MKAQHEYTLFRVHEAHPFRFPARVGFLMLWKASIAYVSGVCRGSGVGTYFPNVRASQKKKRT